jgi:pyridoxamine 5'-phosphate oxidase
MDNFKILKDLSKFGQVSDSPSLEEKDFAGNPIEQVVKWIDHAISEGVEEPNPMVLSTISEKNSSSSRVVLLKYITDKGFVFFTNYESRKGRELEANPNASAVIYWPLVKRQIRIEGHVERVDSAFSDKYFNSRLFESQLGALASKQSEVIPSKSHILEKIEELSQSFHGKKIIRPYFWGGYIIIPTLIEFWQGQSTRLNDRLQYRKDNENWILERLAP